MNVKTALDYSNELTRLEAMIADTKRTLKRVEDAETLVDVQDPFSTEGMLTDALSYAALDLRKNLEYLELRYAEIKEKLSGSFF